MQVITQKSGQRGDTEATQKLATAGSSCHPQLKGHGDEAMLVGCKDWSLIIGARPTAGPSGGKQGHRDEGSLSTCLEKERHGEKHSGFSHPLDFS